MQRPYSLAARLETVAISKRSNSCRRFLAAVLLLTCLFSSCGDASTGLVFTLLFDDAKGLRPGQPVVFKGVYIGEVTSIAIDPSGVRIGVRIYARHRGAVYREARFFIEKARGRGGEMQITVEDQGTSRTPIQVAEVLRGDEDFLTRTKKRAEEIWDRASEAWKGMTKTGGSLASSPEWRTFHEELLVFSQQAQGLSRKELEQLRRDELPRLQQKAEALKGKLEQKGKIEEALELERRFEDWLAVIED